MGCSASEEEREAATYDADKDGILSKAEMREFVVGQPTLWQTVAMAPYGFVVCAKRG